MKILYLEDDVAEAKYFTPKLMDMGFEPVWEKSVEGVVQYLDNSQEFGFGIFDIKIGQDDAEGKGITAAKRFVQEKNMPVFLLSNHTGDPAIIEKARQAGIPVNFIFPKKVTEGNEELFRQYLLNAVESNAYEQFMPKTLKDESPGDKIGISTGQGGVRWFVSKDDILFLEADGDGCKIFIRPRSQGEKMIRFGRPLKQALEQLKRFPGIVRLGNVAINLEQMERVEDGYVFFAGSKEKCRCGTAAEAYYAERGWNMTTAH